MAEQGHQNWRTPRWLFDLLQEEFGEYTMDAAASGENTLVRPDLDGFRSAYGFIDEEQDAMITDLERENVFINPPYGRREGLYGLGRWVERFRLWSRAGCTVTAILPNATSELWFAQMEGHANEIRLVTPRLSFLDENGVPQSGNRGGTAIGVWRPSGALRDRSCHVWLWNLRGFVEANKPPRRSSS
jgi:phage N-6-adenine-methyltransferase